MAALTLRQALDQAMALHRSGQIAQAERLYVKILEHDSKNPSACHLMGVLRLQQNRPGDALVLFDRALAVNPNSPDTLFQQGSLLLAMRRADLALVSFDKALGLDARNPDLHFQRGASLLALERSREARESFRQAVALRRDFAEALVNLASLNRDMGDFAEALAGYERALAVRPDFAHARHGRAQSLWNLGRLTEALDSAEKALLLEPNFVEALVCRGNILRDLGRCENAIASYDRALHLEPAQVEAVLNRGGVLMTMGLGAPALEAFDVALGLKPDHAGAWYNRGLALLKLSRPEEALVSFDKVLAISPNFSTGETYNYVGGDLLHLRMSMGDWQDFEARLGCLDADVRAGKKAVLPYNYLGLSESPADLQICAVTFARHFYPARALRAFKPRDKAKIRIGYLSNDFRDHATAYLMARLFELHDRISFEIIACDTGGSDGGPMRKRLEAAFDKFLDLSGLSAKAAADQIAVEEIDILVNLQGYFGVERTGIFAEKPSPVQVNYLVYPGTLGAPYIDYIIADACVIPEDERQFYTEKVVYLPDTYQANDDRRAIAAEIPSRAENGLPGHGFVFCCFNHSYKVTPRMFSTWMRILGAVDGSVLWLLETNKRFAENLRREAVRQGVAAERLVFAPVVPPERHLARLKLADLFLDTLPYNAHTTASDALWAGVPVLTCRGKVFAGRVAASLLQAIGLPELVAETLENYEVLAVRLARDPVVMRSLREKLARNRETFPLFDSARFCQHMEKAYAIMWDNWKAGRPAQAFSVPAWTESP